MENSSNDLFDKVKTIWLFLGPIFGGLFVVFSKRWHIRYQIKRQARIDAGKELFSAFFPEIQFLQNSGKFSPDECVYAVITKAFTKHQEAVINFTRHLGRMASYRFNRAWQRYCCEEVDDDIDDKFAIYIGNQIWEEEIENRKIALKKIEKLMSFTKP